MSFDVNKLVLCFITTNKMLGSKLDLFLFTCKGQFSIMWSGIMQLHGGFLHNLHLIVFCNLCVLHKFALLFGFSFALLNFLWCTLFAAYSLYMGWSVENVPNASEGRYASLWLNTKDWLIFPSLFFLKSGIFRDEAEPTIVIKQDMHISI